MELYYIIAVTDRDRAGEMAEPVSYTHLCAQYSSSV